MAEVRELAMFPLGTVLFPTLVLPLHLFEPRYRTMIGDVLAADGTFGVVLIERGSEVGGDDVRIGVGTVASVHEARELPDGRWAVVAVGTERIRVEEWLPDDPYPRARVAPLPDPEPDPAELTDLDDLADRLRAVLAKAARFGEAPADPDVVLADDPVVRSYQLAALTPVSTLDHQDLLAATSVGMRLARLDGLLRDVDEVYDLRAGSGDGSGDPDGGGRHP